MDPANPPPKKSSLIPVLGAEGGIILVLVVLIAVTFNYFNILPISKVVPFLPHKDFKNGVSQNSNNINGELCQNLPKNINLNLKQPSSSVSAALAAYSGVWQGKWDGITLSTLIVNDITPYSVYAIYTFRGVSQDDSYRITGNKISSPPLYWQMLENGNLLGVYKTASGSASYVEMKKCK